MKKFSTLVLLLVAINTADCQTTYNVGPGQTYTTLQAAYNAIPATISTSYIIQLESGYNSLVETFPLIFTGRTGASSINTITIRPGTSGLVVSSSITGAGIQISGASYVLIDGRVNGTGNRDLQIVNLNTNGKCLYIKDGSSNCTLQYCNMIGVSDSGMVAFANSNAFPISQGNKIQFNKFSGFGSNYPKEYISNTSTGRVNTTLIYGNEFVNFLHGCNSHSVLNGMNLRNPGSNWIIRANHFYETDSVFVGNTTTDASYIRVTTGTYSFFIDSNYFGGSTPFCSGNPSVIKGNYPRINIKGIYGEGAYGTTTPGTYIRSNTFQNIVSNAINGSLIHAQSQCKVYSNQFGSKTVGIRTYFSTTTSISDMHLECITAMADSVSGNRFSNFVDEGYGSVVLVSSSFITASNLVGSSDNGDSVKVYSQTNKALVFSAYNESGLHDYGSYYNNRIEQLKGNASLFFRPWYAIGNYANDCQFGVSLIFDIDPFNAIPCVITDNTFKNLTSSAAVSLISLRANNQGEVNISRNRVDSVRLKSGFRCINAETYCFLSNCYALTTIRIENNLFTNIETDSVGGYASNDFSVSCINERTNASDYFIRSNRFENFTYRVALDNNSLTDLIRVWGAYPPNATLGKGIVRGNVIRNVLYKGPSSANQNVQVTCLNVSLTTKDSINIEDNFVENVRDYSGVRGASIIGIDDDNSQHVINYIRRNTLKNVYTTGPFTAGNIQNPVVVGIKGGSDTCEISGNNISGLGYTSFDSLLVQVVGICPSYTRDDVTVKQNFIGYLINNSRHAKSLAAAFFMRGTISANSGYKLKFCNNLINFGTNESGNLVTWQSSVYGVFHNGIISSNAEFMHNTFYLKGIANNCNLQSACFFDTITYTGSALTALNYKFYDNVFWNNVNCSLNADKHRTFVLPGLINTSMDFNDYWKGGVNNLGSFDKGTSNLIDLTAIKNALPGQNIASISTNPNLINPDADMDSVNMGPTGTPLTGAGFYFSSVTNDYYGISRNNPPTIGAIELAGYIPPVVTVQNSGCLPFGSSNSIAIEQILPLQWTNYSLKNSSGTVVASGLFSSNVTSINNLPVGIYTLTFSNTSSGKSTSQTVIILTGTSGTLNVNTVLTPACSGGTGSAVVTATGGTSPYQYSGIGATNTTGNYSGLTPGNYVVNVVSNEGCEGAVSFAIQSSPAISTTVDSLGAKTSCTQNNGYIKVSASGGTPVFSFSIQGSQNSTGIFSNLASGNYNVTVTDAVGCSATTIVNVANQAPVITISETTIANTRCASYNGEAQIQITGGNVPYTFHWNNGATTQNINNLNGGSYSVTVTDNGGCTANKQVNVPNNVSTVSLNIGSVTANTNCTTPNGTASVSVSGGSSPYNYNWSNGSTGAAITNLPSGNLTVTATDDNQCTSSLNVTVPDNRPVVIPTANSTNETVLGANDGTAIITVNGGQSPYSFQWSSIPLSGDSVANLVPGQYSVTVTDLNGCSGSTSFTILAGPTSVTDLSDGIVSLYPNPATDELNINLYSLKVEQVFIYNVAGKLVSQTNKLVSHQIDVSYLASGVYIAEIRAKEVCIRKRWIKM